MAKPKYPNWTLCVENFGPIRKAEMTMAPLVLLVGPNNSGKSYLSSLLWGVMNPVGNIIPPFHSDQFHEKQSVPILKTVSDLWDSLEKNGVVAINDAIIDGIIADINTTIQDNLEIICGELTGSKYNNNSRVLLRGKFYPDFSKIKITPFKGDDTPENISPVIHIDDDSLALIINRRNDSINQKSFQDVLCSRLFLSGRIRYGIYMPSARTGLIVSMNTLISNSFEQKYLLPKIIRHFLSIILRYIPPYMVTSFQTKEIEDIAAYIEQNILSGSVSLLTDGVAPKLVFTPSQSATPIPMHASSSLVTELAPFILLLKNSLHGASGLIFEEPEAHLHLHAQRILARAIVRLMRLGIQVTITTHSDTFLQELNLLMQLHQHPDKDRLMAEHGYEEADLLNPDDVRGYEFIPRDGGTDVEPMEKCPQGLVDPLMNQEIYAQSKLALALEEGGGENG